MEFRERRDVDAAILEIDAYHASLARSLEAPEECVFSVRSQVDCRSSIASSSSRRWRRRSAPVAILPAFFRLRRGLPSLGAALHYRLREPWWLPSPFTGGFLAFLQPLQNGASHVN